MASRNSRASLSQEQRARRREQARERQRNRRASLSEVQLASQREQAREREKRRAAARESERGKGWGEGGKIWRKKRLRRRRRLKEEEGRKKVSRFTVWDKSFRLFAQNPNLTPSAGSKSASLCSNIPKLEKVRWNSTYLMLDPDSGLLRKWKLN